MLTVLRPVYYCEFCKRYRLTKHAIESHEPHCIYNPQRVCRWELPYGDHGQINNLPALAAEVAERGLANESDVQWLREQTDGCPACMLAAVVQSGLIGPQREAFNYTTEVERIRAEEAKTRVGW